MIEKIDNFGLPVDLFSPDYHQFYTTMEAQNEIVTIPPITSLTELDVSIF